MLAVVVASLAAPPAFAEEPARAEEPAQDVVVLTDGARHEGRLLDSFGGAYWLQLADGRVLKLPYDTVASVTRADGTDSPPGASPPADSPAADSPPADSPPVAVGPEEPILRGGYDLGTSLAGRLRWRLTAAGGTVLDARFGFVPGIGDELVPVFVHGVSLGLGARSWVHPELTAVSGLAIVPWALPAFGLGGGIVVDPRGPLEVHVGALLGATDGEGLVVPELHASWLR